MQLRNQVLATIVIAARKKIAARSIERKVFTVKSVQKLSNMRVKY